MPPCARRSAWSSRPTSRPGPGAAARRAAAQGRRPRAARRARRDDLLRFFSARLSREVRPVTMAARLRAPGWYRAALSLPIGLGVAFAIVCGVRTVDGDAIATVAMISIPIAFLIGIGCFDYWFRWASGAPTIPEDHSGHGATRWQDYFRVNTDHKVIGIQYIVTTFFFFIIGGLLAMIMRAELAAPGQQFVDPNTFNGLFSVHASLMIFLFIIPVFAGIANYVIPLMIGAPDMAFPRLNALSFWML